MKSEFTPATEEKAPTAPAPVSAETTLVPRETPVPTESSIVEREFFHNENMEGEFDRSDLQIPSFNLVQSVGPLSEHFTPGQLVYNKEEVLDIPAEVTLLRMKKTYQEKLPYGSETLPRRFATQAAARAAGLTPLWEKIPGMGNYGPLLECQVLIGGNAEKNTTWPFEFEGRPYAMARWILQSIAYSEAGKTFISCSEFGLKAGLHTGFFQVTPKREKKGVNFIWLPKVKLAGRHSPAFVSWVADKI